MDPMSYEGIWIFEGARSSLNISALTATYVRLMLLSLVQMVANRKMLWWQLGVAHWMFYVYIYVYIYIYIYIGFLLEGML